MKTDQEKHLYHWQVVEDIYQKSVSELDVNINSMDKHLKPIAKSLYYERKIDLVNLLNEKKAIDDKDIKNILKGTEAQSDNKEVIRKLRKIMNDHDIKHPLRGEE